MKNSALNKSLVILVLMLLKINYFIAQENKGLLWEISGNSLNTPSYLFGTIHIQDKRVFELSDSVIFAIESTDIFAGELNMDSLSVYALKMLKNFKKEEKIEDIISEEEYEKLNEFFTQRMGYPLDKANTQDPTMIYYMLIYDNFEKDMPYSLDEFLFKVAKSNNKQLSSLESFDRQYKVLFDIDSENIKEELLEIVEGGMEKATEIAEGMVEAYSANNIDKILEFAIENYLDDKFLKDELLIKRNINMSEKIDSLVKFNSAFFAVGAGHLPGEQGLIELLIQKNYKLRPVGTNKTGIVDKYLENPFEFEWHTFSPKSGGFEVQMPGIPQDFPIPQNIPGVKIESGIYVDIGKQINYMTFKMNYPLNLESKNIDSVFNLYIDDLKVRMAFDVKKSKTITHDGIKGLELFGIANNVLDLYLRVFIKESNIFSIMIMSLSGTDVSSVKEKYFNSLKFTESKESNDSKKEFKYFTNDKGAFKIKFYGDPFYQVINNNPSTDNDINIYSGVDSTGLSSFFFMYADIYDESFGRDDNYLINNYIENIKNDNEGHLVYENNISSQNYSAKEFAVKLNDEYTKGKVFIYSGRLYSCLASTDITNKDTSIIQQFLDSFEIIDFLPSPLKTYTDSLNEFSVLFPEFSEISVSNYDYSTYQYTTYSAIDTNTNLSYKIIRKDFSKYYNTTDSALFDIYNNFYLDKETISILKDTTYLLGNLRYKDYLLESDNSKNISKLRYVLNGKKLYSLYVSVAPNILNQERIQKFFDSFTILKPDKNNIYENKAKILFDDLISSDTLIYKEALNYIKIFDFEGTHLDKIYELLEKQHHDDNEEISIRSELFEALTDIKNDSRLKFIKRIYPKLPDNDNIKIPALSVLTDINSKESLDLFVDFVNEDTPRSEDEQFEIFYPFYDSLSNFPGILPNIGSLMQYDEYKMPIINLISSSIDSSIIGYENILDFEKPIIEQFEFIISMLDTMENNYRRNTQEWRLRRIVKILPAFKLSDQIINKLKSLVSDDNDPLSYSALVCLLKSGSEVNNESINYFAENLKYRNEFYSDLNSMYKQELFPDKYLTKEKMAEADLYNWLYADDYEYPDTLILIESKKTEEGEFFLYKFNFEESNPGQWFVGISGAQPIEENTFASEGIRTMSNYSTLESLTIEEHWNELLNKQEEQ